ncbi:hypothetical protein PC118_g20960 [Phytophthora cactorum]|uniref:Peptidase A2 domain-containing protein n=2 Tax=Phytophthora cactorum TaxID=29920 RepID=A0A329RA38_9STRA|nr:hypothetical protein PC114_g18227 [Phytophthora cactorum]KAG2895876.1 hypothetical protein PC117_g23125 [Phytophthora cactorum]KAG2963323.1 hypothetical protein PC118_g20960 [Phytophthora cactorum]KAG2973353.1 hypothetical protein PC119_g22927 [Phytophthora cactorum]KAG3130531.1 hypothetical protein C6341_g23715 [Phytophthora cactorum]
MRAMVGGAVNDEQTTILLDTSANASVISERFTKKLRLRAVTNNGWSIDVQGIGKGADDEASRAGEGHLGGAAGVRVRDVGAAAQRRSRRGPRDGLHDTGWGFVWTCTAPQP